MKRKRVPFLLQLLMNLIQLACIVTVTVLISVYIMQAKMVNTANEIIQKINNSTPQKQMIVPPIGLDGYDI